jgi:hypothetical protein
MSKFSDLSADFRNDQMSMDLRHAQMIGAFIEAMPECPVLEIGCCHGVSTAEVLGAAKGQVVLIDYPRFQHSVQAMAELCEREPYLFAMTGLDYLASNGVPSSAVVILDGDHRKEVVLQEIAACLKHGVSRFVLHDVANPAGECDGPAAALTELQRAGFYIVIDQQARPGERTERGIAFVCKDLQDLKLASEAVCANS